MRARLARLSYQRASEPGRLNPVCARVRNCPWSARTTNDENGLLRFLAALSGVARLTAGRHMQGPAAGRTWRNSDPRRRYKHRCMLPLSSPSLTALFAALNIVRCRELSVADELSLADGLLAAESEVDFVTRLV